MINFAQMVTKVPAGKATLDSQPILLELLRASLVIKEAELSDSVLQVSRWAGERVNLGGVIHASGCKFFFVCFAFYIATIHESL